MRAFTVYIAITIATAVGVINTMQGVAAEYHDSMQERYELINNI